MPSPAERLAWPREIAVERDIDPTQALAEHADRRTPKNRKPGCPCIDPMLRAVAILPCRVDPEAVRHHRLKMVCPIAWNAVQRTAVDSDAVRP